ncbi:MAG: hypothetical protein HQL58_01665 [Magnetococcales bacterium]|nr:hypothetical protein [Magnetococcales bacterium]
MVDSVYAMAASIRYNAMTAVGHSTKTRKSGTPVSDQDEPANPWENAFTLDLPEAVGQAIRQLVDHTLASLPPNTNQNQSASMAGLGQRKLELYA